MVGREEREGFLSRWTDETGTKLTFVSNSTSITPFVMFLVINNGNLVDTKRHDVPTSVLLHLPSHTTDYTPLYTVLSIRCMKL